MSIIVPSYNQGFARSKGESAHPGSWDGLVACYDPGLGPTGGTLYDHAGRALHGTLTNMDPATDWVVGERGYALDFDGTDDYVSLGTSSVFEIFPFTIALWLTPATISGGDGVLGKNTTTGASSGAGFFIERSSSTWLAGLYNGSGNRILSSSGAGFAVAGQRTHLAYWFDGSLSRLYVDGIQRDQDTATSYTPASSEFRVGGYGHTTSLPFEGKIGGFQFYSRALTTSEIQQLYLGASPLALRPRFAGYSSQDAPSGDLEADGSLTLSGDATLEGVMYLEADGSMTLVGDATLEGASAVVAGGSMTLTGDSTLNGTGDVDADGSMTLNGDASFVTDADLEADGTLTLAGDASLTAFYSLEASGTFTLSGDADLATQPVVAAGSMTLNGAVTVLGCRRYDGCVGSDFNYAAGAGECADAYAGCADVGDYEYES